MIREDLIYNKTQGNGQDERKSLNPEDPSLQESKVSVNELQLFQ